jgi:phage tail protein X
MAKTYMTVSGDTWDSIAYAQMGSEYYCGELMDANLRHLDYMIFPAGIELTIPEIADSGDGDLDEAYPEWRAILNG